MWAGTVRFRKGIKTRLDGWNPLGEGGGVLICVQVDHCEDIQG